MILKFFFSLPCMCGKYCFEVIQSCSASGFLRKPLYRSIQLPFCLYPLPHLNLFLDIYIPPRNTLSLRFTLFRHFINNLLPYPRKIFLLNLGPTLLALSHPASFSLCFSPLLQRKLRWLTVCLLTSLFKIKNTVICIRIPCTANGAPQESRVTDDCNNLFGSIIEST